MEYNEIKERIISAVGKLNDVKNEIEKVLDEYGNELLVSILKRNNGELDIYQKYDDMENKIDYCDDVFTEYPESEISDIHLKRDGTVRITTRLGFSCDFLELGLEDKIALLNEVMAVTQENC